MAFIIQHLKLRPGGIGRLFLFQHAIHDAAVAAGSNLPFAFEFKINEAHVRRQIPRFAALVARDGL